MIELKNISKKYHDKKVLDDISIKFEKNKLTSLIGPNGAGKTTLLNIITQSINATSGHVLLDEIPLFKWPENARAKRIALLKQSHHISMKLSVKELVSFGRFPYSKGRLTHNDNIKINQALTYMELDDIQDQSIDTLSGGQRQRAFIAMVIAQDTDIIILDEPLNNLDMKHSRQIMRLIRKLVDDYKKTVIIVLHDINFASCYSDMIIALKDGMIHKIGNPNEIMNYDILESLYEIEVDIQAIKDKKICHYY